MTGSNLRGHRQSALSLTLSLLSAADNFNGLLGGGNEFGKRLGIIFVKGIKKYSAKSTSLLLIIREFSGRIYVDFLSI